MDSEHKIFDFATKIWKEMRQLDILSITQNPQEIQIQTTNQLYKLSSENVNSEFKFVSSNIPLLSPPTSKKLTAPAIKMAQSLHQLKKHLHKLPKPAPTMNPANFDRPELYNEILLRKLEGDVDLSDDGDLLFVTEFSKSSSQKMIDDEEEIVSEVNLLENNDEDFFNFQKEEAIKKLSLQIGNIYDEIIKIHIQEEVKRRKEFRFYVDILSIQRRIEIYCSLYFSRNKGETIKNQSKIKILKYCNNKNITVKELKIILRAAKRIENLLKIVDDNYNWSIIDAFPNLKINFFRSTINVHNYEIWLKIVETGIVISEEDGKKIYQQKKHQEIELRKNELLNIYHLANINCSEIISNINWEEDYE